MFISINSGGNGDENQLSNVKDANRTAISNRTVQQMTHGFVALFEKELDQVQYSLKEALYVFILESIYTFFLIDMVDIVERNKRKWALN